jgi:DNA-binding Lrp family transcriptional regulator
MDLDDIDRMILREVSQDAGLSAGEGWGSASLRLGGGSSGCKRPA